MFSHSTTRVIAPAKINLFLEILGKRTDGFHDIQTLIAAIDIYDILDLRSQESGDLDLACKWSPGLEARTGSAVGVAEGSIWSSLPDPKRNLAYRAVELLRQASGVSRGASIRIEKNIPSEAGLGGASSDAAAALIAANQAWGLGWSGEQLAELGAELGSDVPFFFSSGAAICEGRGEQVQAVRLPRLHCVLVKPPYGLSTADVYRTCRPGEPPHDANTLMKASRESGSQEVANRLFNRLEEPAQRLKPELADLRKQLESTGCLAARMTGSGSCCFGVYANARLARRAAAKLRQRNLGWVRAVMTYGGLANQHKGIARWKSLRFA